jgi:hypothetical protein
MWRTWWRRSAQAAAEAPVPEGGSTDLEAACTPVAVGTATINFADCLAEQPQDSLNVWALPFSAPPDPDEAPEAPSRSSAAAAALFFAYHDDSAFGATTSRADGWWLPPPARRSITVVPPARPAVRPPRGVDRIALLHELRGRFDPDQVAGLLTAANLGRAA